MQNDLSPSKTLFLSSISHLLPQSSHSKQAPKPNPDPSVPLSELLDHYIENLPIPDINMLGLMQRSCSIQEQKIHQKIVCYRKLDLFEEMHKVSSELYELKYMDQEELAQVFSDTMDRLIRQDSSLEKTIEEERPFELYPGMGLSHSEESMERDENEDPLENREEKRESFGKMEEFGCFFGLGTRKGKKFPLDFNNIHNFLEENENCVGSSPRQQHKYELGILKEIDLNEGIQGHNSRLYD